MKLGRGAATDYLAISFSSLDVVGHDFGPRSHEIQDMLLRLDDTLGDLLDTLDKKVGRENYVLAFTADHGVATIPEQLTAEGTDAGRLKMTDMMALADAVVSKKFGPGHWVAVEAYTEFYFRMGVFDRIAADPDLLAEVIRVLSAQPGVKEVIDGRRLAAPPDPAVPEDAEVTAARKSYFPGRSGDLVVIEKPNWIFVSEDKTVDSRQRHNAREPVPIRPARAAGVPGRPHREGALHGDVLAGGHRPDTVAHHRSAAADGDGAGADGSAAGAVGIKGQGSIRT